MTSARSGLNLSSIKSLAGRVTNFANAQCDFAQAIFVIGHMRCGSTALSNILCSRPDVSGYGEAHVSYDNGAALGTLTLNQIRRKAWRSDAPYLFDKILHSRYDGEACDGFYAARAIFMVREPAATILSIRNLFGALGSPEYATDALAADYYEARLAAILRLWSRFDARRRIGLSYTQLTSDPDHLLLRISAKLNMEPKLENRYVNKGTMGEGAGDPLMSHKFDSIVPSSQSTTLDDAGGRPNLSDKRLDRLEIRYQRVLHAFAATE
jgi:hypothetical protein